MSAGFLQNGSKSYHSIHSLLQRHSIADSIGAPILRRRPHQQQQSKAYDGRFPHSIYRKIREFEFSSPSTFFSSQFSPTAVSSPKVGLVGWYLGMVKARPILTKSITSALIYTAADLSSQTIAAPASEPYDLIRTFRMAGYGMLILGPSLHFWFNFVSKVLPKRDLITTFKKIMMGQILYGPTMTVVFFSVNAALQGMGVLTCYMKVCYGLSKVTTGENNHLDSETENLENLLLYDEGKNLSTGSGIGNLEV